MTLTHLNPESMHHSPAFSQGVLIEGPGPLLVVGGQNGVDGTGQVVSEDPGEQSAQALRNVITVLESAGCTQDDVVKLSIYLAQGVDITAAYGAAQQVWGPYPCAPQRLVDIGRHRLLRPHHAAHRAGTWASASISTTAPSGPTSDTNNTVTAQGCGPHTCWAAPYAAVMSTPWAR